MSRILRARSTRAVVGLVAALGVLALAGCGAGQITQTANTQSGADGASAGLSGVVVRNAVIAYGGTAEGGTVYPAGGSAPLEMWIVNEGNEMDRLVSASSPAAATVEISGVREVPGGQVLVVKGAPEAPAGPAAAMPQPGAPTAPTTAPTATPRPAATPSAVGMPGADRVAQMTLVGLNQDVRAGLTYPLVLVFERAGEIRFDVPVGDPTEPREAPAE